MGNGLLWYVHLSRRPFCGFLTKCSFLGSTARIPHVFALIVVRRVTLIGRITLILKADVYIYIYIHTHCIYTYLCIDTEYLLFDGIEHHEFGDMITHAEPRQKLLRGDLGNSCVVRAAF